MEKKYFIQPHSISHFSADANGNLSIHILGELLVCSALTHTAMQQVSLNDLAKIGLTWMLRRLHVKIHHFPAIGENILVKSYHTGLKGLLALREWQIFPENNPGKEVYVSADSQWMLIDIEKRKPVRPMPRLYELAEETDSNRNNLSSILNEKDDIWQNNAKDQCQRKASFEYLDVNQHVTQSQYMVWAISSLSFDFLKKHTLTEYEIIHEREIHPDVVVNIQLLHEVETETDVRLYFDIRNSSDDSIHAKIVSVWKK